MTAEARPLNRAMRLTAALAVAVALPEVLVLVLSLARIGVGQGMSIVLLVLGAAAGWMTWRILASAQHASEPTPRWECAAVVVTGLIAGLVYLLLWYVAYLSPDLTCDGTAYHIPAISMWAHRGYVYWIDPFFQLESLVNGYPKAVELWAFIVIRATGLSQFSNTLNLLFMPFGVLGAAALARTLGARRWTALLAGCLWLLIPVNLFQATTAYIDTAFGSLAIAYLALLAGTWQLLVGRDRQVWQIVPALGAAAGLTLAAKGSAAMMVLAGLAALVVLGALTLRNKKAFGQAVAIAAMAGVLALAVGGFWYIRNWVMTGTPLYPVGVKFGERVIFPGIRVAEALWEEGNMPQPYHAWSVPQRILYTWSQTLSREVDGMPKWPASAWGVDSRMGGLGFLWLGLCLPASLYVLVSSLLRHNKSSRCAIWVVAATVVVAFAGAPMNWWARYTVWLYGLGLPALAVLFSDLVRTRHLVAWLARIWVLTMLALGFYEGYRSLEETLRWAYPGRWLPASAQEWLPEAWIWRDGYLFPETRGTMLERVMQSDGPIASGPLWGFAPGGRLQHNVFGQLSEPIGQRELMFLSAEWNEQVAAHLEAKWPMYIIWDGNNDLPDWVRALAERVDKAPGFWIITTKGAP
ncbi:MAG: hypothetical protein GXY52_04765 [Chloroflexi bacterium]|nr:hypothetical protein [Chloroflexota bacterium]